MIADIIPGRLGIFINSPTFRLKRTKSNAIVRPDENRATDERREMSLPLWDYMAEMFLRNIDETSPLVRSDIKSEH